MYRNSTAFRCRGRHGCVYKTVLIMKLTFILLTAGFLQVTAASFAQQVTLKVSNVSIKTIFEKIQEQTQYDFLYKTADLQLTGKLSLDLKDVPLKQALDKCFENVCELDLIFHFDKVHYILDEVIAGGMVIETSIGEITSALDAQAKLDKETLKVKATKIDKKKFNH